MKLDNIRNRITFPILHNAKLWYNRTPRSLEDKKAYVEGIWDALIVIFPDGRQVQHTVDKLEQFFFIQKEGK